jgi:hypothetical protein
VLEVGEGASRRWALGGEMGAAAELKVPLEGEVGHRRPWADAHWDRKTATSAKLRIVR